MPRGGKRVGAGRPPSRDWLDEIEIGQACEVLWRHAAQEACETRLRDLPHADEIHSLHAAAQAVPTSRRAAWLASDEYEDHVGDLEGWLHKRAATPFDEQSGTFEGEAPRLITVSKKPKKGTRQKIIAEVAGRYRISKHTTDRLWKAYRRFERTLRDG